jgi:hypothetical protein
MKPFALRFARFDRIEDFLRQGWVALIPNAITHHHHYGIELAWLCSCPVPGGFKFSVNHRVPVASPESAHDQNRRQQPA